MMLGKRPRPPMRRTTSMSEFSSDNHTDVDVAGQPAGKEIMVPHPNQQCNNQLQQRNPPRERTRAAALAAEVAYRRACADGGARDMGGGEWLGASYMASMVSPRGGHRRYSGDFEVMETGSFLRNCGLCKRRLGPGKDIFMYRGDIAFCSLECRQQQMNLDERKEKCALTSMKEASTASSGCGSEQSNSDGAVIAA